MSWSSRTAQEWVKENPIKIKIGNKSYTAAISREPDFDSVDLIIDKHLNPNDIVILFDKKWKVSHNTGLGLFSHQDAIGFRVYAIKPIIELKIGDKFYLKSVSPKQEFTVKKINQELNYLEVHEDSELLISTFYPEEFIKV